MVGSAFAEIERLERILSRQQPGTAVHRLNRDGILPDPPVELLTVLDRARYYASITEGAFDITAGELVELYAQSFGDTGAPPSDRAVKEARQRVAWQAISTDGRGVVFEQPVTITVDGIAKGFVVDQTVAMLVRQGAEQVMIGAGGDIAVTGTGPFADGWHIGVRDPQDGSGTLGTIRLEGGAVASSGDYMQAFTRDRRFHHIVDPRTGRSPEHTSGVTVIAPTAMDADAISTATLVLGPAAGIALIERLPTVEGVIVTKTGEAVASKGFGGYVI
jgi:thiamine biosynthesis lipoprotein